MHFSKGFIGGNIEYKQCLYALFLDMIKESSIILLLISAT